MSARHCSGEYVDVFEVTGNKVSKVLKKAGKAVEELEGEDQYSWFATQMNYVGDTGVGTDWVLTIYAHS